jgi:hypothetical protein
MITIITMYRGHDAEMFVQAVKGELSDEDKKKWREGHKCDEFHCDDEVLCDDHNNLFFRLLDIKNSPEPTGLKNVDGENYD